MNQINLTLPQSLPTGCWVPLVAVAGSVVSNVVTLPVHAGGGECVDTQSGLTGSQLSPSGGNTLRTGLVALIQTNSPGSGGTRTITNSMALPDGNGGTQLQNYIYSSLSASGLDIGVATADVSISTTSAYGSSAGK